MTATLDNLNNLPWLKMPWLALARCTNDFIIWDLASLACAHSVRNGSELAFQLQNT